MNSEYSNFQMKEREHNFVGAFKYSSRIYEIVYSNTKVRIWILLSSDFSLQKLGECSPVFSLETHVAVIRVFFNKVNVALRRLEN